MYPKLEVKNKLNTKITSFRFILNMWSSFTDGHLCLMLDFVFSQTLHSSSSSLLSLSVWSVSHLFVINITSSGLKQGISLSNCRSSIDLSISGSYIFKWKSWLKQNIIFRISIIHRDMKELLQAIVIWIEIAFMLITYFSIIHVNGFIPFHNSINTPVSR